MFDYIATRAELLDRGADLFARLLKGELQVPAPHLRPLTQAPIAHADLEARRTTGATVLLP